MKIVHVIMSLNIGGAELMLRRLVLHSHKKKQFEHIIITLTDLGVMGPELQNEGIMVHTLGMKSLSTVPLIFLKLQRLLKKIQPDVVQTWMYHSDLLGGLAAKSVGVENIIWGIRNTDVSSDCSIAKMAFYKTCSYLSYLIPKHIVCVAQQSKIFHTQFGYCKDKMIVIPNGFELARFAPDNTTRSHLRSKLNISEQELVIGNIGRFDHVKNHINFIKACIFLLEKGYVFKVLMAGRNVGLQNPKISKLFLNNFASKHFIFMGEITDTSSFYNTIDAFCLCSHTEGFPNVLGEAMASEKICLSTDAGDAWLILSNNGFQIKSTSKEDIAYSIEKNILSMNIKDLGSIGKQARLSIKNKYSIDSIVLKFESLYV